MDAAEIVRRHLPRPPERRTPLQLALAAGIAPAEASRALGQLCERGLAERAPRLREFSLAPPGGSGAALEALCRQPTG